MHQQSRPGPTPPTPLYNVWKHQSKMRRRLVRRPAAAGRNHRFRVAASKSSTAAGSKSKLTTNMKYRSTASSLAPSSVARYRTGPRSASTVRRSPSTAAFSTFGSAKAFASTVSLSARLLRLVRRRSSSAARSLEIGDALKVMDRTEQRWGRRERVHEPHVSTLLAVRQNVSSCRRMRPIDAQ